MDSQWIIHTAHKIQRKTMLGQKREGDGRISKEKRHTLPSISYGNLDIKVDY
jgi:hypothetical protein